MSLFNVQCIFRFWREKYDNKKETKYIIINFLSIHEPIWAQLKKSINYFSLKKWSVQIVPKKNFFSEIVLVLYSAYKQSTNHNLCLITVSLSIIYSVQFPSLYVNEVFFKSLFIRLQLTFPSNILYLSVVCVGVFARAYVCLLVRVKQILIINISS